MFALKLVIAVGAIAYVLSQNDLRVLKGYLLQVDILWLIVSFTLLNAAQLLSAGRMRFYFATQGVEMKTGFSIALYYVGMLYNTVLPGGIGGDGYKVYIAHKYWDFPALRGARLLIVDRGNGLLFLLAIFYGMAACSPIVQEVLPHWPVWLGAGALMTLTGYRLAVRWLIGETWRQSIIAGFYSFGTQALTLASALMLFYALGIQMALLEYMMLFALATVASVLPISVGGAGVRELVFWYGAPFIGVQPEGGIAVSLLFFGVYLAASLIGLLFMPQLTKMTKMLQCNSC